jgi:hypothetical protein
MGIETKSNEYVKQLKEKKPNQDWRGLVPKIKKDYSFKNTKEHKWVKKISTFL